MKKNDKSYFREPKAKKTQQYQCLPSQEDPAADDTVLEKALLRHCKFSRHVRLGHK